MSLDSRRVVIEFDFPGCGDAMLSGKHGLMTLALDRMAMLSRDDKTDARGKVRLVGGTARYVHSYFNSDNLK